MQFLEQIKCVSGLSFKKKYVYNMLLIRLHRTVFVYFMMCRRNYFVYVLYTEAQTQWNGLQRSRNGVLA